MVGDAVQRDRSFLLSPGCRIINFKALIASNLNNLISEFVPFFFGISIVVLWIAWNGSSTTLDEGNILPSWSPKEGICTHFLSN